MFHLQNLGVSMCGFLKYAHLEMNVGEKPEHFKCGVQEICLRSKISAYTALG